MNGPTFQLEIGAELIEYSVKRTSRKTLAISVTSNGDVLIVAPLDATDADITFRVKKRAAWILDKIDQCILRAPQLTARKYVPGETHLYLGRQYRLRVEPSTLGTRREDDRIIVGGVPADDPARIRNRLYRWYEAEGRRVFAARLTLCMRSFGTKLSRPRLKIANMERRWGSYVGDTQSLILNHVLMQVPVPLIDYVITHELCHIFHPHHGPEFEQLLKKIMPDFAERKAKLERSLT